MIAPVKVAEIMRRSSQGILFLYVSKMPTRKYGLSVGMIAAIFSISSVASSSRISTTSSMVMIPTRRFSLSTTGMAVKSYFLNIFAASSWSVRVLMLMTLSFMISPMMSVSCLRSR